MRKELRDGLILRTLDEGHSTDRERLPTFYKETFEEADEPNDFDIWTQELIRHPQTSLEDFFFVVDPAADDKIVSAVLLIPQTWRYEEIEIPFGRIELVATDKAYRRRGLVRELMKAAHERSESLGHVMQGITGIEYYYRQFGYAFAVDLGAKYAMSLNEVPNLKEDEQPTFTLRPVTVEDIPALVAFDEGHCQKALLSVVWSEEMWRFTLTDRHEKSSRYLMIIDTDGKSVGYIGMNYVKAEHNNLICRRWIVGEDSSYLAVFDDVVRAIKAYGAESSENLMTLSFDNSMADELLSVIRSTRSGIIRPYTYAWYMRVPDRARFLQHIKPILERRLVNSAAHRYSGEIILGFYDFTTLKIQFEDGKLVSIENGEQTDDVKVQGAFPYHTWLHLVLGHHDYRELQAVLPDVELRRDVAVVFEALFPKKRSFVVPIG